MRLISSPCGLSQREVCIAAAGSFGLAIRTNDATADLGTAATVGGFSRIAAWLWDRIGCVDQDVDIGHQHGSVKVRPRAHFAPCLPVGDDLRDGVGCVSYRGARTR
jgi:hypothetical protein